MPDRVGDRFLHREFDRHDVVVAPAFAHQQLPEAVGNRGNCAGIRRDGHVELTCRAVGNERAQFSHVFERDPQLLVERSLSRLGPVAGGQRLLQLD
jgi:hypothetical protein